MLKIIFLAEFGIILYITSGCEGKSKFSFSIEKLKKYF